MESGPKIDVSVWRGAAKGEFVSYAVPYRQDATVLDVVTWIQRNAAPDLAYRFACRVGVCGSCAMTVNDRPTWTCRTHVSKALEGGRMRIAPLRNMPVIKDLACDMDAFFAKWKRAVAYFEPTATRDDPLPKIASASPGRREIDLGIECINCAVCHAACDVVAWSPDYLGPAALNRAWTLQVDERDGAHARRAGAVTEPGGCQCCHSQQSCAASCPVGLNPTRAIARLKAAAFRSAFRPALPGKT